MTADRQRHFTIWLGYSLFFTAIAVANVWKNQIPSVYVVAALVAGVFSIGWFAARLDAEYMVDKVAKNDEKPTQSIDVDEEEKKWRSLLHKKEPWER